VNVCNTNVKVCDANAFTIVTFACSYCTIGYERRCATKRVLPSDWRGNSPRTQRAWYFGLTRTSLTNIESGRQHPPLHTFCEIVEQLGTDFAKLLPRSVSVLTEAQINTLASKQVRDKSELEFIQAGLRTIGRTGDGYPETKDSSADNGSTRGK
jgi:DNA-binding XRE family transcriptional regulator